MKNLNVKISIALLIIFSFCGCKEDAEPCVPLVITEIKVVEVPIKCKVTQVKCKEFKTRLDKLTELIRCNYVLKQANKECE